MEKKLSRKEREFSQRKKEILDIALSLFSKRGFHNVTMQDIARKSEFAVGTIYKFFKTKEDLYRELVIKKGEEILSLLIKPFELSVDEMLKIRKAIETKINVFIENKDAIYLYLTETRGAAAYVSINIDEKIKDLYFSYLEKLAEVFEDGIKKGIFPDIDPFLLAIGIDSISNAFLFQEMERPGEHPFNVDLILKIFFRQIYIGGKLNV